MAAGVAAIVCLAAGCRQDMQNQPKFYPQRGTTLFADQRSVRAQVNGTVARSQGDTGSYFLTGMQNGVEADGMPLPVTAALLARGQERFNIYCSPCHSRAGYGHGMVVQRGYLSAASFHTDRLRQAPLGHFFSVMTNGYGAMPEYRAQLTPADRWAVVAYIRALQLSQEGRTTDLPARASIATLDAIAKANGFSPQDADTRFWHAGAVAAPIPTSSRSPATPASTGAQEPAEAPSKQSGSPTSAPPQAPPAHPVTGPLAPQPGKPASPKARSGDPASGLQIYADNCTVCHQDDLKGRPPKIPALLGIVSRLGADHVRGTIVNGVPDARPMMPAFSDRLTEPQIDDLLAYLKAQKAPE